MTSPALAGIIHAKMLVTRNLMIWSTESYSTRVARNDNLVVLPKPRFTSRETASIGRQIVSALAESSSRLGASARHFVINKPAYNWLYSDSVMRKSLGTF